MIQYTTVQHLCYCQSLLLLHRFYYRCCCCSELFPISLARPSVTMKQRPQWMPHRMFDYSHAIKASNMLWFHGDRKELLTSHNIRKGVEEDLPFLPLILPALSPYLPGVYSLRSLLSMSKMEEQLIPLLHWCSIWKVLTYVKWDS